MSDVNEREKLINEQLAHFTGFKGRDFCGDELDAYELLEFMEQNGWESSVNDIGFREAGSVFWISCFEKSDMKGQGDAYASKPMSIAHAAHRALAAERIAYARKIDGLAMDGVRYLVFGGPPYGEPLTGGWVDFVGSYEDEGKAKEEASRNEWAQVVAVPSDPSKPCKVLWTWFGDYAKNFLDPRERNWRQGWNEGLVDG